MLEGGGWESEMGGGGLAQWGRYIGVGCVRHAYTSLGLGMIVEISPRDAGEARG